MIPAMPAVPAMMDQGPFLSPEVGPVQAAVQQMPYSYKGVTAQDIMQYLGEVSQLTPEQMAVADVNQDGTVDLLDATWINQMAEGFRDPNTLEGIDQPAPAQPPFDPKTSRWPVGVTGIGSDKAKDFTYGPTPDHPLLDLVQPPGPPPMMPP